MRYQLYGTLVKPTTLTRFFAVGEVIFTYCAACGRPTAFVLVATGSWPVLLRGMEDARMRRHPCGYRFVVISIAYDE